MTQKLGQSADSVATLTSVYYSAVPPNDYTYCEISAGSAWPDNVSQPLSCPTLYSVTGTEHEYANSMGAPSKVEVKTCKNESQDLQVCPLLYYNNYSYIAHGTY